jgi:hypothetical protein
VGLEGKLWTEKTYRCQCLWCADWADLIVCKSIKEAAKHLRKLGWVRTQEGWVCYECVLDSQE